MNTNLGRRGRIASAAFALGVVVASSSEAEPYIPGSNDEVLETLPSEFLAARDQLTELRARLAANPRDSQLASDVAARYVDLGKTDGDPRFYGYARAAIAPWWDAESPPPAILRLRAKLQEREHLYEKALADLEQLLEQVPDDAQALLECANINRVLGRYEAARAACQKLSSVAGIVPQTLCSAPIQAVTGRAEDAYEAFAQILPLAREQLPSTVPWITTLQAEISTALGRDETAERHFREGLKLQPGDQYLLRAYADFLLDRSRADEALELLREHTRDTGILLRAAIAARRAGDAELAATWTRQLEMRFEEIRLRGGEPHGRFEARHALELKDDPETALELALANWNKQKETRDTRNVLEAAVAARNPAAAAPVLAFLAEHNNEHLILRNLATQLEAMR